MRGFLLFGPWASEYLSALLSDGRLTGGGGLPLCVLVGLWPDVEEPPSLLSGGVRFAGLRRFRHCLSCSV